MAADFPPKGKISYEWLHDLIQNEINPYREDMLEGVVGQVFFHLRHLGLIQEEKIDFKDEAPE